MSAELKVVQGERAETLTEATARRFREQLAGRNITRRDVARAIGKSDPWIGRRAAGQLPFDTDELQAIEDATGISAVYLLTGVNAESRRPVGPNGGFKGSYTPRDSNPEPTVYSSAAPTATVTKLPKRGRPARDRATPATVIELPKRPRPARQEGTA